MVGRPGWPLGRDQLRPYFARSVPHLGLLVPDNNVPRLRARVRSSDLAWDDELLREYSWSYSHDDTDRHDFLRFGPRALRDRTDVICVLRATVTQILTDPTGARATGVEVTAPDGRVTVIDAGTVVLCAGAIENARLLLISDRVEPAGLGNAHDLVGRYLADHPRGEVGRFHPRDHAAVQRLFANHLLRVRGRTATLTVGVALSPSLQRDEELLNGALWVSGGLADDDGIIAALDLLRGREVGRNARHVVAGLGSIIRGLTSLLVERRSPVRRLRKLTLQAIVEQEPDRESRVTLSTTRDALGVPIPRIHWRIGEREAATVRRMATVFVAELARLGHPQPELDAMILDPELPFFLPDVAHPSGTTRMARDPEHGVVDTDCAVHGMTGLYLAGSSVFPTNGHANPTQMIVALTLRLADHLRPRSGR